MSTLAFKIQGDTIELAQLLKACGLTETGGHAKQVIQNGEVQVNGLVETRRGCKIRAGQTVSFGGSTIQLT
ncbi:MAG: RNA-binding protein [Omnitrophica bacterium GWA2_52_12]|nr:MAG: RNA-binding protein [Omnitrophica bacterium GWA2_52_12]